MKIENQENTMNESYPAEISEPKKFSKEQVETLTFRHAHMTMAGQLKENWSRLAILRQDKDGYCACRSVGINGLEYPMTLWSGCLYPSNAMEPEQLELAKQMRDQDLV